MGERQDHATPDVQVVLQKAGKREEYWQGGARLQAAAEAEGHAGQESTWRVDEHADKAAKLARIIGQRCAPKHAPAPRAHWMQEVAWSVAKQHTGV